MVQDRLLHQIGEEMKSKKNILEAGLCQDYVQYRTVVAELKMLRMIEEMIRNSVIEDEVD